MARAIVQMQSGVPVNVAMLLDTWYVADDIEVVDDLTEAIVDDEELDGVYTEYDVIGEPDERTETPY